MPKALVGPPIPLADYIPGGENLLFYLEHAGLEAKADAWRATSAYQLLNTTPVGPMFAEILAQWIQQSPIPGAWKMSGHEAVAIAQHIARNGIIFGFSCDPADPASVSMILVVRGAFKAKELRPAFARVASSGADPGVKAKSLDIGGHKIVLQKTPDGEFYAWWIEDTRKEDLVFLLPLASEAAIAKVAGSVFSTLEKKSPNLASHPSRAGLLREVEGFVPTTIAWFDAAKASRIQLPGKLPKPPGGASIGSGSLDLRAGFQGKELVGHLRIQSAGSGPKPGLAQPTTFEKTGMPKVPEGVAGFTVFAFDPAKVFDQIVLAGKQQASPELSAQIDSAVQAVKNKVRLRLKEDILDHLGPRFLVYNAPLPKGAKTATNPILGMLGINSIPRTTIVVDLDNEKAFERSVDELMVFANQSLRAIPIPTPPAAPGGDPGRPAAKGAKPQAPEFRMVPGASKLYILSFPGGMSSMVPPGINPTVKLGPKQMVLSLSPEAARQAVEIPGEGATGTTFAATSQAAPSKMLLFTTSDPASTLPDGLAAFPGRLQETLAKIRAANSGPSPGMSPTGDPANAGKPGGGPGLAAAGDGSGAGKLQAMVGGGGDTPAPAAPPGYPGAGGNSGGNSPAGAPEVPGTVIFRFDASKLPQASNIRPLIAPASTAVWLDGDDLTITWRTSFPDVITVLDRASLVGNLMKIGKLQAGGLNMSPPGAPAPGGAASPPGPEIAPAGGPGRASPRDR